MARPMLFSGLSDKHSTREPRALNQTTYKPLPRREPAQGTHPLFIICLFGGVLAGLVYTGALSSKQNADAPPHEDKLVMQTSR